MQTVPILKNVFNVLRVDIISKRLINVGVIGVPFSKGQKKRGVEKGPSAIRNGGLINELWQIPDINVQDYGNVVEESRDNVPEGRLVENMDNLAEVSSCNRAVSNKVSDIIKSGMTCISLGGDHSIGIGTVDGHYNANKDMILIWIDAHSDINTNLTSGTGSVHGMTVALLCKELSDYWPYLPTMDWQVPRLSIHSIGYIGLRSVDQYERMAIEKYGIPAFGMEDIEKYGIEAAINIILGHLDPRGVRPIHVSFDIDSLDGLEAPSTGTCVRGGLSLREAILLMETLHRTGRVRAIDLVEVNPTIGIENDAKITVEAAIAVLKAGLGFSRRGNLPKANDLPLPNQIVAHHVPA